MMRDAGGGRREAGSGSVVPEVPDQCRPVHDGRFQVGEHELELVSALLENHEVLTPYLAVTTWCPNISNVCVAMFRVPASSSTTGAIGLCLHSVVLPAIARSLALLALSPPGRFCQRG